MLTFSLSQSQELINTDKSMAACGCVFWWVRAVEVTMSAIVGAEQRDCNPQSERYGKRSPWRRPVRLPSRCNSNHFAPRCGFICLF